MAITVTIKQDPYGWVVPSCVEKEHWKQWDKGVTLSVFHLHRENTPGTDLRCGSLPTDACRTASRQSLMSASLSYAGNKQTNKQTYLLTLFIPELWNLRSCVAQHWAATLSTGVECRLALLNNSISKSKSSASAKLYMKTWRRREKRCCVKMFTSWSRSAWCWTDRVKIRRHWLCHPS